MTIKSADYVSKAGGILKAQSVLKDIVELAAENGPEWVRRRAIVALEALQDLKDNS